jgi:hypothetical protein
MRFYEIAAFLEVGAKSCDIGLFKDGHLLQVFRVDVIPMSVQHAGEYNVFKASLPRRPQLALDGHDLVPITLLVVRVVKRLRGACRLLKLIDAILYARMLPRQAVADHARPGRPS